MEMKNILFRLVVWIFSKTHSKVHGMAQFHFELYLRYRFVDLQNNSVFFFLQNNSSLMSYLFHLMTLKVSNHNCN